tara:strand:- start:2508 stop:2729 length:222 start_codon:yes stop_codon:yes gene_type:complete
MKIFIQSKKPLRDDKLGRLMHGDIVDLPEHKANFYLQRGEATTYETKIVIDRPYMDEFAPQEPKKRGRKSQQV